MEAIKRLQRWLSQHSSHPCVCCHRLDQSRTVNSHWSIVFFFVHYWFIRWWEMHKENECLDNEFFGTVWFAPYGRIRRTRTSEKPRIKVARVVVISHTTDALAGKSGRPIPPKSSSTVTSSSVRRRRPSWSLSLAGSIRSLTGTTPVPSGQVFFPRSSCFAELLHRLPGSPTSRRKGRRRPDCRQSSRPAHRWLGGRSGSGSRNKIVKFNFRDAGLLSVGRHWHRLDGQGGLVLASVPYLQSW